MPSDENNKKADDIADDLDLDWADLADDLALVLGPAASEAGRQVVARVGADKSIFDIVDKFGVDYARRRAAELVGMRVQSDGTIVPNPNPAFAITESTRNMIREKVAAALENGTTTADLRDSLLDDVFGIQRALVIARTETEMAHNQGQLEGARASGMAFKAWLTADAAECDDCDENAEAGVIAIDESFPSGDDAPVAHPNCRCSLVYYSSEDEADES